MVWGVGGVCVVWSGETKNWSIEERTPESHLLKGFIKQITKHVF